MHEFIVVLLIFFIITGFLFSYYRNKHYYKSYLFFLFSPLPVILFSYALIFIFRPLAIIYLDSSTLDYEYIDQDIAVYAIYLALISLSTIIIIFAFYSLSPNIKVINKIENCNEILIPRIFFVSLLSACMLIYGLYLYGSVLNNTAVRAQNPDSYSLNFLFTLVQKIYVASIAMIFYCYLNLSPRNKWRTPLGLSLLVAIPLALLTAGRGGAIYLVITYLVIYYILRPIPKSSKLVIYLIIFGCLIFLVNYIFGAIRIIISLDDWLWADIFETFNVLNSKQDIVSKLVAMSWDYSVFDVLVRIISETEDFTYGFTNLSYVLSFIPRLFWPEKPLDNGYMLYVTNLFYPHIFLQNGSNFAGTIVGEGFVNFGVVGVIFYSFLFSLFCLFIYKRALLMKTPLSIISYALFFPFIHSVVRGGLDTVTNFLFFLVVPLIFLNWIATSSHKKIP
jgi:oligosaccharide repeat unit polymerase